MIRVSAFVVVVVAVVVPAARVEEKEEAVDRGGSIQRIFAALAVLS